MLAYISIIIILILNYTSHMNGHDFYSERDKLNKNTKVFDLVYKYLPKIILSKEQKIFLNWFFSFIAFLPFLFEKSVSNFVIIKDIIELLIPIFIIRGLTTNFTILPADKDCHKDFSLYEMCQGHCYDKLFSGHLAISMVAMHTFWKYNIISTNYAIINLLATSSYMLLTRGHYTNDLIFAFFVVYFVITNNFKIKL